MWFVYFSRGTLPTKKEWFFFAHLARGPSHLLDDENSVLRGGGWEQLTGSLILGPPAEGELMGADLEVEKRRQKPSRALKGPASFHGENRDPYNGSTCTLQLGNGGVSLYFAGKSHIGCNMHLFRSPFFVATWLGTETLPHKTGSRGAGQLGSAGCVWPFLSSSCPKKRLVCIGCLLEKSMGFPGKWGINPI